MHHIFRWPVYLWGGWIAKLTLEMFVRICLTGRHLARYGGCRKHPWSKWWSGGGHFGQLVYRQKELVVMAVTAAVWAPFLIRGGGIFFSLKWFGGLFFFHSGSWWLCASQSCASYPIKSLVFVSKTLSFGFKGLPGLLPVFKNVFYGLFFSQNGYMTLIEWICRNIPSGLDFSSFVINWRISIKKMAIFEKYWCVRGGDDGWKINSQIQPPHRLFDMLCRARTIHFYKAWGPVGSRGLHT